MDLSRQEYPALLTTLQPGQAVTALVDRLQTISSLNQDVVDWLAERRSIEDTYVNGLKRLASKRINAAQLGVFQTPWQSIITTCEAIADSHHTFSQRVQSDVEKPLREYTSKNREMIGIKTMQGNMTSLAKDVEEALKKSDKMMAKGNKADNTKLSTALSSVQEAQQQWESQAPYVFEQLQALDESRVNHLRDVLTQLQTHESDQLERSRAVVASSLESILTVDTSEEISSFVARTTGAAPSLPSITPNPRRMSRHSTSSTNRPTIGASTADAPPVPEVPRSLTIPQSSRPTRRGSGSPSDGGSREKPTPPEPPTPRKSGLGGLRRLGTVMKRNKEGKPTTGSADDKKAKPSRNPLKRNTGQRNTMYQLGSPSASAGNLAESSSNVLPELGAQDRPSTTPRPETVTNGGLNATEAVAGGTAAAAAAGAVVAAATAASSSGTNGAAASSADQADINSVAGKQPEETRQPEKTSSAVDDITRAQQEAAAFSEGDQPQFNVNIRNEPIPEEDGDAEKAISDTANMLRQGAQPPQRKVGTIRGRRDVRNTMFVPNNVASDLANLGTDAIVPSAPADGVRTNLPGSLSPPAMGKAADDGHGSDAQSIRSARSLSSMGPSTVRHPEMLQPGLNASIVETVSATITGGQVSKVTTIGEMALVYNGTEVPSESDTLRLDNFQVLEKVAPNPGFITPIDGRSGEYIVHLPSITRSQVGFKYQVHLDANNLATYAPVLLTPVWKMEPTQASVVLHYAYNPAFAGGARTSVTLQNAVLMIGIENAKSTGCQSRPAGTFSREKGMIYWRLGDVHLDAEAASGKLVARFATEGEATPGTVEARWEIVGEQAMGVGSGLGLSAGAGATTAAKEGGSNPFDEDEDATGGAQSVPLQRRMMSGKYVAT